jgi:hypothetical protein
MQVSQALKHNGGNHSGSWSGGTCDLNDVDPTLGSRIDIPEKEAQVRDPAKGQT